ncbi:hypothetical protein PTTG_02467 [Puccinia triticina 1-1 BBBD Race 1]|uniref:Uncharacterized protein n=2 Tax=Puccinia triticina TaxID=208348 RepID=A0A0C4ENX0_PUCT1|nr:hypothetical protein PTTG_02467 [Puccinia triticina 1-1 BBBD Race 1]
MPVGERYPIVHIEYYLWIQHHLLCPKGSSTTVFSDDYEAIDLEDTEALPIPPCEVPFQYISLQYFKHHIMDATLQFRKGHKILCNVHVSRWWSSRPHAVSAPLELPSSFGRL